MTEPVLVQGLEELIAFVPHAIGVEPTDSILIVPANPGSAPLARLDMPHNAEQFSQLEGGIQTAYSDRASPVFLLAYTDRRDLAQAACAAVQAVMPPSCPVAAVATVNGDRWVRLDQPDHGTVSQSERDRFAAEAAYRGARMPYTSDAEQWAAFAQGPNPIPASVMEAAHATTARALAAPGGLEQEQAWITVTTSRHVAAGTPMSDHNAARLLSDVQHITLRDHAWAEVSRPDARQHAEFWQDILTRAPAGTEAPAAALSAFSYWIGGDGLRARVALGRVPDLEDYTLAKLVDIGLRAGVDPSRMPVPRDMPTDMTQHQDSSPRTGLDHERRDPSRQGPSHRGMDR